MCINTDEVLLFSGGIDSFCAYHFLKRPKTLYFDLKSRYSNKELLVVQQLIPSTIIDTSLDLNSREQGVNAYIPFRNLLLAIQATKYASTIWIAGVKDDNVGDKNEQVFKQMSDLLTNISGKTIQVKSPFWSYTKDEVISWYLHSYKGNPDNLIKTISCYDSSSQIYCGNCPACFRKWIALYVNGIKLDFFNQELAEQYYQRARHGVYDSKRNYNIIKIVHEYFHRH